MKKIIFICLFFIMTGCTVFQPETTTLIQPKLLKQSELPPIRESMFDNCFEFYCEMLINTIGEVEKAKLLNSTGDAVWDSLAELSLLQWKYSPAVYDGKPIRLMVRRKIQVEFAEPRMLPLAELQIDDLAKADSIYNALVSGADFTSLVLKYSTSSSRNRNGFLGDVNVKHFSENLRAALSHLSEGEFTEPLKYGEHYIIFKRLMLNNYCCYFEYVLSGEKFPDLIRFLSLLTI